nr:transcription factor bHLH110-like [Quercus suber]
MSTICRNNNFNSNFNGVFSNPRESKQDNDILAPCLNNSMVQDLGFYWLSNAGGSNSQSALDLKIKEEHSESFRKYTELLHSSSEDYHFTPTSHIKNERNDLKKLLLKTISTKGFYSNAQNCPSFGDVAMPSRGNFSQIYPSINISNLNQSPSSSEISRSLYMNLQALNLLTPERYSGCFSQPSHDSLGLFLIS